MSRSRVRVETPALKSWEEADAALRRVGEIAIARERLQGRADLAINRIKSKVGADIKPLSDEEEGLLLQLQQFAEARKSEFTGKGKKKTKKLVFGALGFRASARLLKLIEDGDIINLLREFGYDECIRVKESVDAEAIKKLDEGTIEEVGCRLEQVDAFWVEPDRAKIEEGLK